MEIFYSCTCTVIFIKDWNTAYVSVRHDAAALQNNVPLESSFATKSALFGSKNVCPFQILDLTLYLYKLPFTLLIKTISFSIQRMSCLIHLDELYRAVRNVKQAKITKWKILVHSGIQTHNPQITRLMPYPLDQPQLDENEIFKVNFIPVVLEYVYL